jgi:hypothetical protein
MTTRRTNKGVPIDLDRLIAGASSSSPAVGNMQVNANGDVIRGGAIVKRNEERVREYYQKNPRSSTSTSLKGEMPKLQPDSDPILQPKTAKTAKENARTSPSKKQVDAELEKIKQDLASVIEPDEFSAPEDAEPLGYKEVELPNGDIEMVPYYKAEDSK